MVDSALLRFTVFDYDVLTANDFGGEAFLALGSVAAGTSDNHSSGGFGGRSPNAGAGGGAAPFYGLQPTQLPLLWQQNKGNVTGGVQYQTQVKHLISVLFQNTPF